MEDAEKKVRARVLKGYGRCIVATVCERHGVCFLPAREAREFVHCMWKMQDHVLMVYPGNVATHNFQPRGTLVMMGREYDTVEGDEMVYASRVALRVLMKTLLDRDQEPFAFYTNREEARPQSTTIIVLGTTP